VKLIVEVEAKTPFLAAQCLRDQVALAVQEDDRGAGGPRRLRKGEDFHRADHQYTWRAKVVEPENELLEEL